MKIDLDEARDYLGNEVNCSNCHYQLLLAQGKCDLLRACMQDRYARRIDRFFKWNPELANECLAHAYFEVRAVAAKYADIFHLPALLHDEDDTVRWSAAQRLPPRYLLQLRQDPSREVRIRVASRLTNNDLVSMRHDPDYYVRMTIAKHLPPHLLTLLLQDAEAEVRRIVAIRIGTEWLMSLAGDPDAGVRLEACRRMTATQLTYVQNDPDWRVRYEVACRIGREHLDAMRDDADPLVREQVQQRLQSLVTPESNDNGE